MITQMDVLGDELNVAFFERFIKDQEQIFANDKSMFQRKESSKNQRSSSSNEGGNKKKSDLVKPENSLSQLSKDKTNDKTSTKRMVKDTFSGGVFISPREREKDKLINALSVPKSRHSYPSTKVRNYNASTNKFDPSRISIDVREREKDRLADIFAGSASTFSKTSNNRVCKELKSEISQDKNQFNDLNKYKNECSKPKSGVSSENNIIYDEQHNNPKIVVSEYKEKLEKNKKESNDLAMVRIGEFSPLNPNNPAGRPTLGVGEYEERRKLYLDQRKQELNQYLQQAQRVSRGHTPERDNISAHNQQFRSVSTQTNWEEASQYQGTKISPRPCFSTSFEEQYSLSPSPRRSLTPKCYEGVSEKEVKEQIYREELHKQIEENRRIKEEIARKEAEEEAKIEAKIQRDLEKLKWQYEAERLERLDLALRKKEQEDILRESLGAAQKKALEERKAKRKQRLREKSISPKDSSSQRCGMSKSPDQPKRGLSRSMPASYASKAISEVHEVLRKPLLDPPDHRLPGVSSNQGPPKTDVPSRNVSALDQPEDSNQKPLTTSSPPTQRVQEVDILAQNESRPQTSWARDNMKEVEELLKQPLLPESFQVLPPMSPPLLYATVPPINPSLHLPVTSSSGPPVSSPKSPPVPACKRLQRHSELLEEKWKVPYVERYNAAPSDVFTKHNRSVLTQLGAFRRHLQQERLRMQQRVQEDSP